MGGTEGEEDVYRELTDRSDWVLAWPLYVPLASCKLAPGATATRAVATRAGAGGAGAGSEALMEVESGGRAGQGSGTEGGRGEAGRGDGGDGAGVQGESAAWGKRTLGPECEGEGEGGGGGGDEGEDGGQVLGDRGAETMGEGVRDGGEASGLEPWDLHALPGVGDWEEAEEVRALACRVQTVPGSLHNLKLLPLPPSSSSSSRCWKHMRRYNPA